MAQTANDPKVFKSGCLYCPSGQRTRSMLFTLLIETVFLLQTGCAPHIPETEPLPHPLPSLAELTAIGPIEVKVAPDSRQETVSNGWYIWNYRPKSTGDYLLYPIALAHYIILSPLTLPLTSYNASSWNTYIRDVAQEMNLRQELCRQVSIALQKNTQTDKVVPSEGEMPTINTAQARAATLELSAVKLYLNNAGSAETLPKGQRLYSLAIESRWILQGTEGHRNYGELHQVTTRTIGADEQFEIPYEIYQHVDEHAEAIVSRFTNPQ
ncbi:MAG: hypothetical protein FIB02_12010 [Desulfuromonas sp.]|nr:hypothetical protein [Desulfuromonas sp.]